jgi:hypothetical protein
MGMVAGSLRKRSNVALDPGRLPNVTFARVWRAKVTRLRLARSSATFDRLESRLSAPQKRSRAAAGLSAATSSQAEPS